MGLQKYRNGKYDGFETDPILLAAFEHATNSDILDENSAAHKIWSNGIVGDLEQYRAYIVTYVIRECYASDTLCWGNSVVDRDLNLVNINL